MITMVKSHVLSFSVVVIEAITAAVIGTSKIVAGIGE
jgi:hypothetical protein